MLFTGVVIYLSYGIRHSKLGYDAVPTHPQDKTEDRVALLEAADSDEEL